MRKSWLAFACASLVAPALAVATASLAAPAPGGDAELAKQLSNPVSSLISVPFQFNYDCCYGPEDGARFTLNIQPVIPINLNPDWTLIIRTILPVISQQQTVAGMGNHFGLGDTVQSFFFSPTPKPGGVIWGVGPAIYWPTASSTYLGPRKWGAGPTAVVLKQQSRWTGGILANHIWSFGGESETPDVNSTFLQPFLNYTWPDTTGITLNTESSYNWETDQWSVPINLTLSRIFRFGTQPVSFQIDGRYYALTPIDGPRWGARFAVVFLFPA
jgi:hypothetical protein